MKKFVLKTYTPISTSHLPEEQHKTLNETLEIVVLVYRGLLLQGDVTENLNSENKLAATKNRTFVSNMKRWKSLGDIFSKFWPSLLSLFDILSMFYKSSSFASLRLVMSTQLHVSCSSTTSKVYDNPRARFKQPMHLASNLSPFVHYISRFRYECSK